MRTLIIDNHTKHLKELIALFPDSTVIKKDLLCADVSLSDFDLIVLSGGTNVHTVLRHPDDYQAEIDLIMKANIPIIGICLGAEIICNAFGGKLEELIGEHRGKVSLNIENIELEKCLSKKVLEVIEGHKIGFKKLPRDFISCARSSHGIEIIKHTKLPIFGFQFHPEISNVPGILNWVYKSL